MVEVARRRRAFINTEAEEVSEILDELERYGSTREHLVDLSEPSPRGLRFADLMQATPQGTGPVVAESNGRALIYVVDGRRDFTQPELRQWVRRIAFRGDADWLGVLRPGQLDVYPAVLDGARDPQLVSGLPMGAFRLPALVHKTAVDEGSVRMRLRNLLFQSMKRARTEFSLSPQDALSLVGRALFWRFLVDRGLLKRLEPSSIVQGPSSWAECFDRKRWALATFEWLDTTFNGGLLEFETRPDLLPAKVFTTVAGGIAHKADSTGQLSLPASWAEVDFAHVPVGLLSEVYEAFVHDADKQRATEKSLFYTPRYLAEYIVDEALDALEDVRRPRVLDPAAGAGVFLAVAFRALVAREWQRLGTRPSRRAVRRILNKQLKGFDIDGNALRLAELALYLTAIELDPERNPRPLDLLKFEPPLRGTVLIEQPGGRLQGSLSRVPAAEQGQYDLVVGNPPWTALKLPKNAKGEKDPKATQKTKKMWADSSRSIVTKRLGAERAKSFDFPDANPDLPFIYRAMEWCRKGGIIALITHARWLFGQSVSAVNARADLLQSVHVTGVLNGAALRLTNVWPNVDATFCMLFATNEVPPERAAFYFVSPELDTSDLSQDRLRIDWRDAEIVETDDVLIHPWLLKVRFRGTPVDESIVRDVYRRGVQLGQYLKSLDTKLWNGYRPGNTDDSQHMWDLYDLHGHELAFFIDSGELEKFSHLRVDRKRKLKNFFAPLLVVHESMVVDVLRPRAGLATASVAYDERFDGVSFAGIENGLEVAKYLQLVFQSSLITHLLLMLDGQFGVEREVVHLETLEKMPVVPWTSLSCSERSMATALSDRLLGEGLDADLYNAINAYVAELHGLSEVQRDSISDTLSTGLTSTESRLCALQPTTSTERHEFVTICELGLRDVLSASEMTAFVRTRDDLFVPAMPWHFVQVDWVREGESAPEITQLSVEDFVQAADAGSATLVTLRVTKTTTLIGILDRYRYWTRTKGRLLASMLLSEDEG